jgi:DNA polymerase IV
MSVAMEACVECTSPAGASKALATTAWPARHQSVAMRGLAAPHVVCAYVDGFFAAVEQVLEPRFRGRPVVIVHENIVCASYEAGLLGITTGMTMAQAVKLCRKTIVVSGRYGIYAEYAEQVRRILESVAPAVDADGHHGFYLNFLASPSLAADFAGTLRRLQLEVLKKTGLGVSVGAGRTRVVAGIAARLERPRGLRVVEPGIEESFLASLPVDALHGIEGIDANDLRKRGVSSIGELRRVPLAALQATYGDAAGRKVWEISRGRDRGYVPPKAGSESFSREAVIDCGTTDAKYLSLLTEYLCKRIRCALRDASRRARAIAVRIRYVDQFAASQSLRIQPTSCDDRELFMAARALLQGVFTRQVAVQSLKVFAETFPSPGTGDSSFHSSPPAVAASA